jgi:hypothetical protein
MDSADVVRPAQASVVDPHLVGPLRHHLRVLRSRLKSEVAMEMSKEDGALLGLSTLGLGNYFKLPNLIVGKEPQAAARTFDCAVLDQLVREGLALYNAEWSGYALTETGAKRVMEVLLVESPMDPIDAVAALVNFGAAVGIQKADGGRFMVNILMGGAAYVAMHKDLGEAVRIVKEKVDRTLIGS